MPRYRIQTLEGQVLDIEGDTFPTEAEIDSITSDMFPKPEKPALGPQSTFADVLKQPDEYVPISEAQPEGRISPGAIVPAIRKVGGDLVPGEPGDTHPDIIERYGLTTDDIDQRGFFDKVRGTFLDRRVAADATGLPTEREPGNLHSTDLPAYKGLSPEEVEQVPKMPKGFLQPAPEPTIPQDLAASALGVWSGVTQEAAPGMMKVLGLLSEFAPVGVGPGGVAVPPSLLKEQARRQQRTPQQLVEDYRKSPFVTGAEDVAKFWRETIPVTDQERQSLWFQAPEQATAMLPYALTGPTAPLYIGAESAANHLINDYDELRKNFGDEEAARIAIERAYTSGVGQALVFQYLPKPLRMAADKYIVEKFGSAAVNRLMSKRAAHMADVSLLFGAAHVMENLSSGKPPEEGVPAALLSGIIFGGLTPYGATRQEMEKRRRLYELAISPTPEERLAAGGLSAAERTKAEAEVASRQQVQSQAVEAAKSIGGTLKFTDEPLGKDQVVITLPDGTMLANRRMFHRWLDIELKGELTPQGIRSMIQQEFIHGGMRTIKDAQGKSIGDTLAEDYWNTLTAFEKWVEGKLYDMRGLSDTDKGHEAIRRRFELLHKMTPAELLHLNDLQQWSPKSLSMLAGFVRKIRETARTAKSQEGLNILDALEKNIATIQKGAKHALVPEAAPVLRPVREAPREGPRTVSVAERRAADDERRRQAQLEEERKKEVLLKKAPPAAPTVGGPPAAPPEVAAKPAEVVKAPAVEPAIREPTAPPKEPQVKLEKPPDKTVAEADATRLKELNKIVIERDWTGEEQNEFDAIMERRRQGPAMKTRQEETADETYTRFAATRYGEDHYLWADPDSRRAIEIIVPEGSPADVVRKQIRERVGQSPAMRMKADYSHIGIVDDRGNVEFKVTKPGQSHDDAGLYRGARFRYDKANNEAVWSDVPTADQIEAVDNRLARMGIEPRRHTSWMDTMTNYRTQVSGPAMKTSAGEPITEDNIDRLSTEERGRLKHDDGIAYGIGLSEKDVPRLEEKYRQAGKDMMKAAAEVDDAAYLDAFGRNNFYGGALQGATKGAHPAAAANYEAYMKRLGAPAMKTRIMDMDEKELADYMRPILAAVGDDPAKREAAYVRIRDQIERERDQEIEAALPKAPEVELAVGPEDPPSPTKRAIHAAMEDFLGGDIKARPITKALEPGKPPPRVEYDFPTFRRWMQLVREAFPGATEDSMRWVWNNGVAKHLLNASGKRLAEWRKALKLEGARRYGTRDIADPPIDIPAELLRDMTPEEKQAARERMEDLSHQDLIDVIKATKDMSDAEAADYIKRRTKRKLEAQKYRRRLITEIMTRLQAQTIPEVRAGVVTEVFPDMVAYEDNRTSEQFGVFHELTDAESANLGFLETWLAHRGSPNKHTPKNITRRVTALIDRATRKVELVSTYEVWVRGKKTVYLYDPRLVPSADKRHLSLQDLRNIKYRNLPRYRIWKSILLRDPVKNFHQRIEAKPDLGLNAEQVFMRDIGEEARARTSQLDKVWRDFLIERGEREAEEELEPTEMAETGRGHLVGFGEATEPPETAVEEAEGGGFTGPHAVIARAEAGLLRSNLKHFSRGPMTTGEAGGLVDFLAHEEVRSVQDIKDALQNASLRARQATLAGYRRGLLGEDYCAITAIDKAIRRHYVQIRRDPEVKARVKELRDADARNKYLEGLRMQALYQALTDIYETANKYSFEYGPATGKVPQRRLGYDADAFTTEILDRYGDNTRRAFEAAAVQEVSPTAREIWDIRTARPGEVPSRRRFLEPLGARPAPPKTLTPEEMAHVEAMTRAEIPPRLPPIYRPLLTPKGAEGELVRGAGREKGFVPKRQVAFEIPRPGTLPRRGPEEVITGRPEGIPVEDWRGPAMRARGYGISERAREERAMEGRGVPVEPGELPTDEEMIRVGQERLKAGGDPEEALSRFEDPEHFSMEDFSLVRAKGEELQRLADEAEDTFGHKSAEYRKAAGELARWDMRIKAIQTDWAAKGRLQQGTTDVNTGSFSAMERRHREETGDDFTDEEAEEAKAVARRTKRAQREAEEAIGRHSAILTEGEPLEPQIRALADEIISYGRTQEASAWESLRKRYPKAGGPAMKIREGEEKPERYRYRHLNPNTDWPGIMGVVKEGVVAGRKVENLLKGHHELRGMGADRHTTMRWRYDPKQNVVTWVWEPTPEVMDAVDNWLHKQGIDTSSYDHIPLLRGEEMVYRQKGVDTAPREGPAMRLKDEDIPDLASIGASRMVQMSVHGTLTFDRWKRQMAKELGAFLPKEMLTDDNFMLLWSESDKNRKSWIAQKTGPEKAFEPVKQSVTRRDVAEVPSRGALRDAMARMTGAPNPRQARAIWNYVRSQFLDRGETDYPAIVAKVSRDLGMSMNQVHEALAAKKTARVVTIEMYKKLANQRRVVSEARNWLKNLRYPGWQRFIRRIPRAFFIDKIFGHGYVPMVTHAAVMMFDPGAWKTYWPMWLEMYKMGRPTTAGEAYHARKMLDLQNDPLFWLAKRARLQNDPFKYTDDYRIVAFHRAFRHLTGNRGFDALKLLRQARFNQLWDGTPDHLKTMEMARLWADSVNHATGIVKTALPEFMGTLSNWTFFAPKLEASRWAYMIADPMRATGIFAKWGRSTPEQRHWAMSELMGKAWLFGMYATLLAMNQGILKALGSDQNVNVSEPRRGDFLAFKVAGFNVGVVGPIIGMWRMFARMFNAARAHRRGLDIMGTRQEDIFEAIGRYGRGKLSPFASFGLDVATGQDYRGAPLPWSRDRLPNYKRRQGIRRYDWGWWLGETFAPIPAEEAIREVWRGQGMGEDQIETYLKALGVAGAMAGTGARITEDIYQDVHRR